MIAVFDTNVLIAAIITEGVCAKLLRRARTGELSLVSCPFIMTEVRRILARKFRLSHEEVAAAIHLISEATSHITNQEPEISGVCRDRDDDHVLACALAARAHYLVTGDTDLLSLGSFRQVRIVTPRDVEALFA
ncbi:PilT protein domain-containing protein [Candidatus Methylomirabilis lanthanidiphila]|uniref:PilT protein domain-containing protein n=1 Tax=Candidatus Methylomirabilis lanthanidiphila TaxID=2211376 RepID=A0A564ZP70_9BACT|nr:PilT protein domain-containing protein [Candidatus Methylomirabilis lanthanidiphila]